MVLNMNSFKGKKYHSEMYRKKRALEKSTNTQYKDLGSVRETDTHKTTAILNTTPHVPKK